MPTFKCWVESYGQTEETSWPVSHPYGATWAACIYVNNFLSLGPNAISSAIDKGTKVVVSTREKDSPEIEQIVVTAGELCARKI